MILSIPPRNDANTNTTAYWENFLTDDDIQQIVSLPQWQNLNDGLIGQSYGNTIEELRKSKVSWFYPTETTNHIWEKIKNAIAQCNANYFKFDLTGCYEPGQLTLYSGSEQEYYDWHIDSGFQIDTAPRKLSMSLLLNDTSDFEGGELMVKTCHDVGFALEQKKGRAWFFPSHTFHKVTPVTKGIRRSLVLWIGGPPFR